MVGEGGVGAHLAYRVSHPLQCLRKRWGSSENLRRPHFRDAPRTLSPVLPISNVTLPVP